MRLLVFFFFVCAFAFGQNIALSDSDVKAFYTAQGGGKNATGGRGGVVYHVTNLNNSGPGSLRYGCEEISGPRVIVFDVAGDIFLTSNILISPPDAFNVNFQKSGGSVTIAGETAPSPGITLRNKGIQIHDSNVIIRYITIRLNEVRDEVNTFDCIRIRNFFEPGTISDYMFDHLTLSHGDDEVFNPNSNYGGTFNNPADYPDVYRTANITMQSSIIGEANGPYNVLVGPGVLNTTFFKNYFYNTDDRNVLWGYGLPLGVQQGEQINNIIYNYGGGATVAYGMVVDIIGNIFKSGPADVSPAPAIGYAANAFNNPGAVESDGALHHSNNFILGNGFLGDSNANNFNDPSRVTSSSWNTAPEFTTVNEIQSILNDVGNSIWRDSFDDTGVSDYFNGTGDWDTETIPNKTANLSSPLYVDSDGDGLSDEYEVANGAGPGNWFVSPSTRPVTAQLVSGVTIDQTAVTAAIRYTHMDIFLGELAGDWTGGSPGGGGTNDPATDKGRSGTSAMLIAH